MCQAMSDTSGSVQSLIFFYCVPHGNAITAKNDSGDVITPSSNPAQQHLTPMDCGILLELSMFKF